jgi:4'-phosphopantetheinyl transferase
MSGVYLASLSELAGDLENGSLLLPPGRRNRLGRYLKTEDQLRCLAGGLLLRRVLGVRRDEDLILAPGGKPCLAGSGPHFNLSHSGSYVGLSVGSVPNGLDLEAVKEPLADALPGHVLSREEFDLFTRRGCQADLFYQFWTGKESLLKASGLGLRYDPCAFSITLADGQQEFLGKKWFLAWQRLPGHWLALASAAEILELRIIWLRRDDLL